MSCRVCSKSNCERDDFEEVLACYSTSGDDGFRCHITKTRYVARCRSCKALYDCLETEDFDFSSHVEIERTPTSEEALDGLRRSPPSGLDHGLVPSEIPRSVEQLFDAASRLGKGALIATSTQPNPQGQWFAHLYSIDSGRLVLATELILPAEIGPAQAWTLGQLYHVDTGNLGGALVWGWNDGFSIWSRTRCELLVSHEEIVLAESTIVPRSAVKEIAPRLSADGICLVLTDGRTFSIIGEPAATSGTDAAWTRSLATHLANQLRVPAVFIR